MAHAEQAGTADPPPATVRRPLGRLLVILPLAASIIVGAALAWSLTRNPREIPSALVGKPVPAFDLPAVEGRSGYRSSTCSRRGAPPAGRSTRCSWR